MAARPLNLCSRGKVLHWVKATPARCADRSGVLSQPDHSGDHLAPGMKPHQTCFLIDLSNNCSWTGVETIWAFWVFSHFIFRLDQFSWSKILVCEMDFLGWKTGNNTGRIYLFDFVCVLLFCFGCIEYLIAYSLFVVCFLFSKWQTILRELIRLIVSFLFFLRWFCLHLSFFALILF